MRRRSRSCHPSPVELPRAGRRLAEPATNKDSRPPAGPPRVVPRRGDRQLPADRLDPVLGSVLIDERHHHHFDRRSSSTCAKNADALRRISFAPLSSPFSRSSPSIRSYVAPAYAGSLAFIDLGAPHPLAKGLQGAADLLRYRADRRSLRPMVRFHLMNHPYGSLSDLRRKPRPLANLRLHSLKCWSLREIRGVSEWCWISAVSIASAVLVHPVLELSISYRCC